MNENLINLNLNKNKIILIYDLKTLFERKSYQTAITTKISATLPKQSKTKEKDLKRRTHYSQKRQIEESEFLSKNKDKSKLKGKYDLILI